MTFGESIVKEAEDKDINWEKALKKKHSAKV